MTDDRSLDYTCNHGAGGCQEENPGGDRKFTVPMSSSPPARLGLPRSASFGADICRPGPWHGIGAAPAQPVFADHAEADTCEPRSGSCCALRHWSLAGRVARKEHAGTHAW